MLVVLVFTPCKTCKNTATRDGRCGIGDVSTETVTVAGCCSLLKYWIFIISDFLFYPVHKDTESAQKAAEIRIREERELKTVSLFTSLSYSRKNFSWKKICELEELFQKMNFDYLIWWLGHFLKASSLKISELNTVQEEWSYILRHNTIWHDMTTQV